mmetsp:Transcript_10321/g.33311  ORF Transcript_10321/g.33311 Transcript_10321/m.33311 type:complete len:315 (+) Transcript_10321:111-1055(+)
MSAAIKGRSRAAIILLLMVALGSCAAQMPGMGSPKKQKPPANKEDVKLITCQVCEEMVKSLHRDAKKMRDELPKHKKNVEEMELIKKVEKVCDPETAAGDWINKYDLVEEGRYLKVVEQESFGKCGTECRTIARACEKVVGEYDTDIAEALWKGDKKRAALTNLVCYELSETCIGKTPKMPKGRKPGPTFQPLTDKEREMATMMHGMQGIDGMPGMQMFQRDELLDQMQENYGDYLNGDGEDDFDFSEDKSGGVGVSPPPSEAGGADEESAIGKAASAVKEGLGRASEYVSGLLGSKKESGDASGQGEADKGEL